MVVSLPFFVWGGGQGTMMRRLRDWIATLVALKTAAPLLVPLAAWILYLLGRRLSRLQLVIVELGLLVLLALLVYLRRDEWWRAVTPKYVSTLAWLAGPVRDELAARICGERAGPEPEGDDQITLVQLSHSALLKLEAILEAYDPLSSPEVLLRPAPGQEMKDLVLACQELERERFLSEVGEPTDSGELIVVVHPRLREGLILQVLRMISYERGSRQVWRR